MNLIMKMNMQANQTRTQSLFIWLETILAERIWSEINYEVRGAFWEETNGAILPSSLRGQTGEGLQEGYPILEEGTAILEERDTGSLDR